MADEPQTSEPSDEHKNVLKGLIKEAFAEWVEENKPEEPKTQRPKGFLDSLFS